MTTWFTSDWHIGHANIIKLCDRPFDDVHHMNKTITSNYQSVVKDDDHVYMLGDICWSYQNVPKLLARLPGHKKLVIGNHDKCFKQVWKLNTNPKDYYKFYLDAGFESIDTSLVIDIAGQPVNLSHFPYQNDNRDDRYHAMRLVNDSNDRWLIHGHIHNKGLIKDRMINVSVEMWDYKPVHIDTLSSIITNKGRTDLKTNTILCVQNNDNGTQTVWTNPNNTIHTSVLNKTSLINP